MGQGVADSLVPEHDLCCQHKQWQMVALCRACQLNESSVAQVLFPERHLWAYLYFHTNQVRSASHLPSQTRATRRTHALDIADGLTLQPMPQMLL